MQRVYLGNLDPSISKEEITDEVGRFGKLVDVWVARNPPGFAFITFEDDRDAQDMMNDLSGGNGAAPRPQRAARPPPPARRFPTPSVRLRTQAGSAASRLRWRATRAGGRRGPRGGGIRVLAAFSPEVL